MGRCEYKVPGGKLLRAKAEARDGKLSFVQVTGDFFMTPETDLEKMEEQLVGMEAEESRILDAVCGFFEDRGTVITGASPSDIASVIIRALGLRP